MQFHASVSVRDSLEADSPFFPLGGGIQLDTSQSHSSTLLASVEFIRAETFRVPNELTIRGGYQREWE